MSLLKFHLYVLDAIKICNRIATKNKKASLKTLAQISDLSLGEDRLS